MFNKEQVKKLASLTSSGGQEKVKALIDDNKVTISNSNSAVCFGFVNGYGVSVDRKLNMHCMCTAWKTSKTPKTCKHGCALAMMWLEQMPAELLPLEDILDKMHLSELLEKVLAYAEEYPAFDQFLRK